MNRFVAGAVTISLVVGVAAGAAGATGVSSAASGPRWVREVGNFRDQMGFGVALDAAGNAYVAAFTKGRFPGSGGLSAGGEDAVLAKYNPRGGRPWTVQFGSPEDEIATAVAVDSSGGIDVAGFTAGTLPGSPDTNAGLSDIFVTRFTSNGDRVWTRQLGGPEYQTALGVTGDAKGNVYVSGWTSEHLPGAPEPFGGGVFDAFVAKYDSGGKLVWVHELGSDGDDQATAIAATPGGGVDVVGYTDGALPGAGGLHGWTDAFIAHYDGDGSLAWTRQLGTTSFEHGTGIAVDSVGNAFLAGVTFDVMPGSHAHNQGQLDIFVIEFGAAGEVLRTVQLGSPGNDQATAVAVDDWEDVYVTGYTGGTLPGSSEPVAGEEDAFVVRFDPTAGLPSHRVVWVHQLGSTATDWSNAIAVTPSGAATIAGYATGPLPGSPRPYAGKADLFVAQYRRSG